MISAVPLPKIFECHQSDKPSGVRTDALGDDLGWPSYNAAGFSSDTKHNQLMKLFMSSLEKQLFTFSLVCNLIIDWWYTC